MKKVNVEKWCVANDVNVVSILKMLKQSKVVVYVIGAAHYVDADEVLKQAISGSCERQKLSHLKRVENGKKLAEKNQIERDYLMATAIRNGAETREAITQKIAELREKGIQNGP